MGNDEFFDVKSVFELTNLRFFDFACAPRNAAKVKILPGRAMMERSDLAAKGPFCILSILNMKRGLVALRLLSEAKFIDLWKQNYQPGTSAKRR